MANLNQPSKIYCNAKKAWNSVVETNSANPFELQLQLDLHKRLLSIFQPGNYWYFVFNLHEATFEFVSQGIVPVLGYNPEEIDTHLYINNIHPDDKPYFLQFEQYITVFFKELPYDKIQNYKVQYDFRHKTKNNQYIRVLHQIVVIEYDEKNLYRSLVLDTDITHIKYEGEPVLSIIGLEGEQSYYKIQNFNTKVAKSYDLFTRKERQILKLIVENESTKEIADRLFISSHTVNAHRKNILRKANVKTPVELVCKAIREGWI